MKPLKSTIPVKSCGMEELLTYCKGEEKWGVMGEWNEPLRILGCHDNKGVLELAFYLKEKLQYLVSLKDTCYVTLKSEKSAR